jgi:CHASE3 domain sensor protein
MTVKGRIAALVIAGLAALGGVLVQVASAKGGGIPLLLFAALILLGTVFDAGYLAHRRSAGGTWQLTAEREVDHQTGQILQVWYDPVSGERRYLPTGERPD